MESVFDECLTSCGNLVFTSGDGDKSLKPADIVLRIWWSMNVHRLGAALLGNLITTSTEGRCTRLNSNVRKDAPLGVEVNLRFDPYQPQLHDVAARYIHCCGQWLD